MPGEGVEPSRPTMGAPDFNSVSTDGTHLAMRVGRPWGHAGATTVSSFCDDERLELGPEDECAPALFVAGQPTG